MIEKADGDYDAALASLRTVESKYPRDRVVLNQIGPHPVPEARVPGGAEGRWSSVGQVDPEDVQMHYTRDALLARPRATRRRPSARRSCSGASRPTSRRRRSPPSAGCVSPEDNNERQPIHEHESVPLPASSARPRGADAAARRVMTLKRPLPARCTSCWPQSCRRRAQAARRGQPLAAGGCTSPT